MLEFIERFLSWLLLAFCIFMLLFTIVRLIVMIAYDFDVMLFLICIIVVSTMVNLVNMQNYGELHDKNFDISMEFNLYDMQFSKFKVVYKGTQIYYRDRVFFSIDTLFLYTFCHWLFHLFLADLDYQNRTRIEEV